MARIYEIALETWQPSATLAQNQWSAEVQVYGMDVLVAFSHAYPCASIFVCNTTEVAHDLVHCRRMGAL